MKTIHKAYKFRMYPNEEQKVFLAKHFGCVRVVYNHFLNERKEQYDKDKKSDNYHAQCAKLTQFKKNKEVEWLKEVNSQSLQFALRCVDTAYVNFFRRKTGFPRFKSKKEKNSFTVPQGSKLKENAILLPKFKEYIKIKIHQSVLGKMGKVSVTRSTSGKYFACILTEQTIEQLPKNDNQIGIDLGLTDFIVTSNNENFKNNRYTKKYAEKLRKAQQHLARKKGSKRGEKPSKQFEKQKLKVARIHEKIANARLDTLHKVSYELVKNNQLIVIEDLHVKGMIKNRKLAKHIADASWGNFIRLLEYKCEWHDRDLIPIDRWYPSSKTCNICGDKNKNLTLKDRKWTCKNGHELDRDYNASLNILKEGLRLYRLDESITEVESVNKTASVSASAA